ncbi:hypothetical protein L345_05789, partial [Ophiophagus hannah]
MTYFNYTWLVTLLHDNEEMHDLYKCVYNEAWQFKIPLSQSKKTVTKMIKDQQRNYSPVLGCLYARFGDWNFFLQIRVGKEKSHRVKEQFYKWKCLLGDVKLIPLQPLCMVVSGCITKAIKNERKLLLVEVAAHEFLTVSSENLLPVTEKQKLTLKPFCRSLKRQKYKGFVNFIYINLQIKFMKILLLANKDRSGSVGGLHYLPRPSALRGGKRLFASMPQTPCLNIAPFITLETFCLRTLYSAGSHDFKAAPGRIASLPRKSSDITLVPAAKTDMKTKQEEQKISKAQEIMVEKEDRTLCCWVTWAQSRILFRLSGIIYPLNPDGRSYYKLIDRISFLSFSAKRPILSPLASYQCRRPPPLCPAADIAELEWEFSNIFDDKLGKYTGTPISFNLDPNIAPVRLKPQRVPEIYADELSGRQLAFFFLLVQRVSLFYSSSFFSLLCKCFEALQEHMERIIGDITQKGYEKKRSKLIGAYLPQPPAANGAAAVRCRLQHSEGPARRMHRTSNIGVCDIREAAARERTAPHSTAANRPLFYFRFVLMQEDAWTEYSGERIFSYALDFLINTREKA